MAEVYVMSDEQKQLWAEWVAERPPVIKALCERFSPNRLYRHKVTKQLVTLSAFFEDNTVEMIVSRRLNDGITPSRKVFGVEPDNLEEADLPEFISVMTFEAWMDFLD